MKLIHLKPENYPLVLAMGAVYDGEYYIVPDHLPPEPFIPWLPAPLIQLLQPVKLTIELVPQTCWFSNVRSNVSSMDWGRIKKITAENAGYRCQICHGKGVRWPVECHEIWEYDDLLLTQRLAGFIALCPPCHQVKHIGLSFKKNLGEQTINHLARINQWSLQKAQTYIKMCFNLWKHRSQFEWSLDISVIQRLGIHLLKTDRGYQSSNFSNNQPNPLPYFPSPVLFLSFIQAIAKRCNIFFMIITILIIVATVFYISDYSLSRKPANSPKSSIITQNKNNKPVVQPFKRKCEQYSHEIIIDGVKTVTKGTACLDQEGKWRAIS